MASTNSSVWYLDHLLKWLEMFDLKVTRSHTGDLSDGVAIALVLNKIDPSWFNEAWISKIKQNVGSNKILKVSNLKKVVERVVDFYCIHDEERPTGPDVNRIGENDDEGELCRLLQLVLGCAVRCERKQEFIQAILSMEEDVQQGLMAAIEELPVASGLNSNTDSIDISPQNQAVLQTDLQTILRQLESANEAKEQLSRQCQQLNLQISLLQDERHHLQAEVELLRKEGLVESSLDREGTNNDTIRELKRQVLLLREELDRTETAKEEFRMRVETLEMDLGKLRIRQEELQNAAEQTRSLKDEVDILRERSARLATAESTIDSMRKKIEEVNDLKRQLRKVEEKNAQYIQQNMELEEELKKLGPWKSQLEVQKKQNADIQAKLDEERKKADKFEFQNKNLQSKLEALTQEKERLVVERDKLKDINEELKYAQLNPGNVLGEQASSTTGVDTLDMIPHEIKEKLLRLEHENRLLRQQQDERQRGGPVDKAEVLQTVIDGHQERINRLEAENRKSNQRVLELESQLDELRTSSPGNSESNELKQNIAALTIRTKSLERDLKQKVLHIEELEVKLSEQEEKTKMLREVIHRRETEMQAMEERYKKCIEKAKIVLKNLNPNHNPASTASPEIAVLQSQLREKDRLIESLERETERYRALREAEDQMMTTAFYNLGMQLQRQAMEQRLNSNSAQSPAIPVNAAANTAQSFLARQRQTNSRGRSASINNA